MIIIWYDSINEQYEYGSSTELKILKAKAKQTGIYTVLMQFNKTEEDKVRKITLELNKNRLKSSNEILD